MNLSNNSNSINQNSSSSSLEEKFLFDDKIIVGQRAHQKYFRKQQKDGFYDYIDCGDAKSFSMLQSEVFNSSWINVDNFSSDDNDEKKN